LKGQRPGSGGAPVNSAAILAVHGTALSAKKAVASLRRASDPTRRLTSRDHANLFRDEYGELPRPSVLARLAGIHTTSASQMLERLRREAA
jgi:hypothetical protein